MLNFISMKTLTDDKQIVDKTKTYLLELRTVNNHREEIKPKNLWGQREQNERQLTPAERTEGESVSLLILAKHLNQHC